MRHLDCGRHHVGGERFAARGEQCIGIEGTARGRRGDDDDHLPERRVRGTERDPLADLKEKARAMVRADRVRTLMLLRAWLSADHEKPAAQPQGADRA